MDIQDMRIFARVAAVQNLSAVGTELGLTPGTISKRIQSLEDELSARLFDRTTRSIRITEEGVAFLAHVERILSEIEAARASVDDKVTKPKGKLKIAAPACLGRRYVAPALCEFVRAFPEIDVQVDLHDRQVNLQEDGYDVAIRTGALSDSSLIAKRLAPDRHVIAAAPSYLTRAGCPLAPRSEEHTSELQSHVNLVCRLLLEKKKIHAKRSPNRFKTLKPVRQALHRCFGAIAPGLARGLKLRHDHGSIFLSGDFPAEIESLSLHDALPI